MVKIRFVDPDEEPKKEVEVVSPSPPASASPSAPPLRVSSVASPPDAWLTALGWHANPFHGFNPRPASEYFIGHDDARRELAVFLAERRRLAVIVGGPASGKSLLLATIIDDIGKDRDHFVVHVFLGPLVASTLCAGLTKPYNRLFRSYRGSTPQNLLAYLEKHERRHLIVCIDDANDLGDAQGYLQALCASGRVSVISTGVSPVRFGSENLVVTLGSLRATQVRDIIRRRIAGVGGRGLVPFTIEDIDGAWRESGFSLPKLFVALELLGTERATPPSTSVAPVMPSNVADEKEKDGEKDALRNGKGGRGKRTRAHDDPREAEKEHSPLAPSTPVSSPERTKHDALIEELGAVDGLTVNGGPPDSSRGKSSRKK